LIGGLLVSRSSFSCSPCNSDDDGNPHCGLQGRQYPRSWCRSSCRMKRVPRVAGCSVFSIQYSVFSGARWKCDASWQKLDACSSPLARHPEGEATEGSPSRRFRLRNRQACLRAIPRSLAPQDDLAISPKDRRRAKACEPGPLLVFCRHMRNANALLLTSTRGRLIGRGTIGYRR
jgi:hypothetical protein